MSHVIMPPFSSPTATACAPLKSECCNPLISIFSNTGFTFTGSDSLAGRHIFQPNEVKALKAYLKKRTSNIPALFLSRNATPISRRRFVQDWIGHASIRNTVI